MVRKFTGLYKNDEVDVFLKELGAELKYLSLLLSDYMKNTICSGYHIGFTEPA